MRLHSAIGYVAPKDRLEGRQQAIWDERDRKLALARERRQAARQASRGGVEGSRHRPELPAVVESDPTWAEDRATLGSDPSAAPGVKTEGRAALAAARHSDAFGFDIKAINPRCESEQRPDRGAMAIGVSQTGGNSISG